MRPIARPQHPFRTPLNGILGTEANVRILRVLADSSRPLPATLLAQRTRLDPSGVRRALRSLERCGIIRQFGESPGRGAELSPSHPMGQALRALFAVERARTEDVLASLEKEMRPLYGVVTAAWVRGPLLTDLFEADDSLVITVVALRVDHRRVRSMLQRRITAIGASSGIQIRLELRSLPPHTSKPRHITVPRDALVLERAAPAAPRLPVCGEPP